ARMRVASVQRQSLVGAPVDRTGIHSRLRVDSKSPVVFGDRRIRVVPGYHRRVERDRSARSQDASQANVRDVVACYASEDIVASAFFEIKVQGPDIDRLRLEPKNERVRRVVKLVELRHGGSAYGYVVRPKLDMPIRITIAGMH